MNQRMGQLACEVAAIKQLTEVLQAMMTYLIHSA